MQCTNSMIRQNFDPDCEAMMNRQINIELYSSYVYLAMAFHFDREDVALNGFHEYFKKASAEENEHARKFMKYLNKRGGRIVLSEIPVPDKTTWVSAREVMQAALELEKKVNLDLLELHECGTSKGDANLCDFLETNFLQCSVDAIKEFADHVVNLGRVGNSVGVYMYDRDLIDSSDDEDIRPKRSTKKNS